jgi:hypothetical protein
MADYYRSGRMLGVEAMYAEAFPNWGEGPKLYVALKLQWNPGLDIDSLLREWYERAVGKDAAPYLEEYYKIWEKFWTQAILKSRWFTPNGQYLRFVDPSYLEMVTDEISQGRKLLESVAAKTKTPDQRARANLILRAFEYYEASAISYAHNLLDSVAAIFRSDKASKESFGDMSKKRLTLVNEFQKDPVLVHPLRFDRYKTLQW